MGALSSIIIGVRRLPLVSALRTLIPRGIRQWAWQTASSSDEFTVLGSRMRIPPESRNASIVLDRYEPEVAEKLAELLRPGMTFCDVGANLGVFSLYAARLVGPEGRVFAFEPIPGNYRVLEENLRLNRIGHVRVFHLAVSEQAGQFTIYLSRFCGCHSLVPDPPEATGEKIQVQTMRLDSIEELHSIDAMKIDTEGAELGVLRSLGRMVVPHVILECNTVRLKAAGISGEMFLNQLHQMGYAFIQNLDEPAAGLSAIRGNREGSWNLYLRHESVPR